jgi:hypothetical protein
MVVAGSEPHTGTGFQRANKPSCLPPPPQTNKKNTRKIGTVTSSSRLRSLPIDPKDCFHPLPYFLSFHLPAFITALFLISQVFISLRLSLHNFPSFLLSSLPNFPSFHLPVLISALFPKFSSPCFHRRRIWIHWSKAWIPGS